MPLFDAVTPAHVPRGMEEHGELGAQESRDRYGFGPAREYVLVHDGRSYDSKAILGVALKHAAGRPATSEEFSGGTSTVTQWMGEATNGSPAFRIPAQVFGAFTVPDGQDASITRQVS